MDITGLAHDECLNVHLNTSYAPKNFAQELDNAVSRLTPEQPYQFFELGLTLEDMANLQALRIEKSDRFTNVESEVDTVKLKTFIESLSPQNSNISESITRLISNMVNNAHNDKLTSKDTVNVFFLTTSDGNTGGEDFEWHLDTIPYEIKEGVFPKIEGKNRRVEYDYFSHTDRSNIVISLKGPTTWIYPMSDENRDEYNFYKKHPYRIDSNGTYIGQSELTSTNFQFPKVVKADFGQGAVFKIDRYQGALHTTPIIKEERLFMAIINIDKKTAEKQFSSQEGKMCYGQTLEEYERNQAYYNNYESNNKKCPIVDETIFKMR